VTGDWSLEVDSESPFNVIPSELLAEGEERAEESRAGINKYSDRQSSPPDPHFQIPDGRIK
jgi:hypothetical protein